MIIISYQILLAILFWSSAFALNWQVCVVLILFEVARVCYEKYILMPFMYYKIGRSTQGLDRYMINDMIAMLPEVFANVQHLIVEGALPGYVIYNPLKMKHPLTGKEIPSNTLITGTIISKQEVLHEYFHLQDNKIFLTILLYISPFIVLFSLINMKLALLLFVIYGIINFLYEVYTDYRAQQELDDEYYLCVYTTSYLMPVCFGILAYFII